MGWIWTSSTRPKPDPLPSLLLPPRLYQSAAGSRFCRLLRSVNYHILASCQEHSKKIPFMFRFQKEKNPFTYEFAYML